MRLFEAVEPGTPLTFVTYTTGSLYRVPGLQTVIDLPN